MNEVKRKRKSSKTVFKLPNVIPEEVDKQFGFAPIDLKMVETNLETTKISDLKNFSQNITVVDELKNTHNVKVSTIIKENKLCCFWDRHETDKIIYCPLDRIQKPKIKHYTSFINGKQYKIQDSIQDEITQEYYVDGVFCSVECALAFIKDNAHNSLYSYSENYLRQIYSFTGNQIAPHWRVLKEYGGNMTIDEFRKSFTNTTYNLDGVIFNPVCFLFKENYHL